MILCTASIIVFGEALVPLFL